MSKHIESGERSLENRLGINRTATNDQQQPIAGLIFPDCILYTVDMVLKNISGGGRFEKAGAYSRVKRVGPFVYVAGLTAMQANGKVYAPYDTYEQSVFIFNKIEDFLKEAGAKMRHVVCTRAYLTDLRDASGFIRRHGEIFQGIEPVLTGVQAGLTTPGMMIEIDVEAIIHSRSGKISLD